MSRKTRTRVFETRSSFRRFSVYNAFVCGTGAAVYLYKKNVVRRIRLEDVITIRRGDGENKKFVSTDRRVRLTTRIRANYHVQYRIIMMSNRNAAGQNAWVERRIGVNDKNNKQETTKIIRSLYAQTMYRLTKRGNFFENPVINIKKITNKFYL